MRRATVWTKSAGRRAGKKVDVHEVAKDLQQARRELRLIRMGGPIDAEKVAQAQRALADLRAVMREGKKSSELMLTEIYLHLLSRRPSEDELRAFQKQLAAKPDSDEIYDDVFWALLNSKEFLEGGPAAQPPADASKPAVEASKAPAAGEPRAATRSLQEEAARLTAQLKLQQDKLRAVETERAALIDQVRLLAERVHALQSAIKKDPAPATSTPSRSDAPATRTSPANARPESSKYLDPNRGSARKQPSNVPAATSALPRQSPRAPIRCRRRRPALRGHRPREGSMSSAWRLPTSMPKPQPSWLARGERLAKLAQRATCPSRRSKPI